MKKTIPASACAALIILFSACSKSSEDKVSTSSQECDTTNMSYSADVVPILQANCYSCHGEGNTASGGGIALYTYSDLVTWANNGALVAVITHASGYPAMPQNGNKLSDCDINKITAWVNNGVPDN